ncbi:hypothetical protein ACIGC1_11520 [Peribacillus butanolivorans]|uniref:hypothetical protein n=1 Tax=Peribacillus butanolivorans TaxID=421767 RepID=UPI0037C5BE08
MKVNKKEIRLSAMSSLNAEKEEGSTLLFNNAEKFRLLPINKIEDKMEGVIKLYYLFFDE